MNERHTIRCLIKQHVTHSMTTPTQPDSRHQPYQLARVIFILTIMLCIQAGAMLQQGLMSHSTLYRSFQRRSSQPVTWLVQKTVFLTNHLAGTSNTKISTTKWQHKNLNNKSLTYAKLNVMILKPGWGHLLYHPAGNRSGLFNTYWANTTTT